MRTKFDEQLHMLNQEMMHMGSMIEERIQKAIEALIGQDSALAKEIMDGDSEVDREQKKIENICFNLLMQQQPVARVSANSPSVFISSMAVFLHLIP